jgi:hypothetical protein
MHICTRGQRHARHFQSRILFILATALLVTPALAAGPVGTGGPVVVLPPKAPSATPTAPGFTPTSPIIPNDIPSPITAALDRVVGGKTNNGTAQPHQMLIALLLPAVQDGKATVDWGDGGGMLPPGNVTDGNAISVLSFGWGAAQ